MRTERRWLTSVTKEAARTKVEMPWTRGTRRAEWIAKRDGAAPRRAASA